MSNSHAKNPSVYVRITEMDYGSTNISQQALNTSVLIHTVEAGPYSEEERWWTKEEGQNHITTLPCRHLPMQHSLITVSEFPFSLTFRKVPTESTHNGVN